MTNTNIITEIGFWARTTGATADHVPSNLVYYLGIPAIIFSMMFVTLMFSFFIKEDGRIVVREDSIFFNLRRLLQFPFAFFSALKKDKDMNEGYYEKLTTTRRNSNYFKRLWIDMTYGAKGETSLCGLFWGNFISFFIMLPLSLLFIAVAITLSPIAGVIAGAVFIVIKLWILFVLIWKFMILPIFRLAVKTLEVLEDKRSKDRDKEEHQDIKDIFDKRDNSPQDYRTAVMLEFAKSLRESRRKGTLWCTHFERFEEYKKNSFKTVVDFSSYRLILLIMDLFQKYALKQDVDYCWISLNRDRSPEDIKRRTQILKPFFQFIKKYNLFDLIKVEASIAYQIRDRVFVKEKRIKRRKENWAAKWAIIKGVYNNHLCPKVEYQKSDGTPPVPGEK